MSGHLSKGQLTALAEECVSKSEKTSFEAHMRECSKCREEARENGEVRRRLLQHATRLDQFSVEDEVRSSIADKSRVAETAVTPFKRPKGFWSNLIGGRTFRFAAGAAALFVVVAVAGVFFYTPSQAWTLAESIQAIQGKRGVYFSGSFTVNGERLDCEMWIRGKQGEPRVQDMVLRGKNGITMWVRENATYFYNPAEFAVYTDDAQTAGFTHWPGAEFLELLRRVTRNPEIDYRIDLFGRRRLIVFKARLVDAGGAKSFILEFDPASKLLVRLKWWQNLDWSGDPAFEADTVSYLDSPPDSLFEVDLPGYVVYRERDVSIAPEMIGLLRAPSFGLEQPGLSEVEASRKIVEEIFAAEISWDLARFRRLAPVATLWDDEQMKAVLGGVDGQELVVQLVEVGEVRRRGRSPLGPLFVVPVVVRQKDGKLYEHKLIVQIRQGGGPEFSCVVYGPYGAPYPVQ